METESLPSTATPQVLAELVTTSMDMHSINPSENNSNNNGDDDEQQQQKISIKKLINVYA